MSVTSPSITLGLLTGVRSIIADERILNETAKARDALEEKHRDLAYKLDALQRHFQADFAYPLVIPSSLISDEAAKTLHSCLSRCTLCHRMRVPIPLCPAYLETSALTPGSSVDCFVFLDAEHEFYRLMQEKAGDVDAVVEELWRYDAELDGRTCEHDHRHNDELVYVLPAICDAP